jgi:Fe-S-cluster containining protein
VGNLFSANSERYIGDSKALDLIQLNQKIAYKGKIGRLREQYCLEQIRYIKVCHNKIGQDQIEYVHARGENISCIKGCSFCCRFVYIGATLQECEAIAYYLSHHEPLLNNFVMKYPSWQEVVRHGGDLFYKCEQLFNEMLLSGADEQKEQAFQEALRRYNKQNIACPFLENGLCLIYEVRPSNCAGFFVTQPPERCQPHGADDPKFNITTIDDVVSDTSFYYGSLSQPITLYMPVAVYRILEQGFLYLRQFPGLEMLGSAALSDPEIKTIIQSYSSSY